LKSVGHDEATNTLEVEFANGAVYQYPNTPKSSYHQIVTHASSGEMFHRVIRQRSVTTRKL